MVSVKFKCPQCGSARLGEYRSGAVLCSDVMGFEFLVNQEERAICSESPEATKLDEIYTDICYRGDPEPVELDGDIHLYYACKDCGSILQDRTGNEIQHIDELF